MKIDLEGDFVGSMQIDVQREAYMKLYPRDSQRICTTYSYFARYLYDCIYDRFGILDKVPFPYRMPQYSDADVVSESLERCCKLDNVNIAWSGGIDSSFLVACYYYQNLNFRVCYNDMAVAYAPDLLNKLKKIGIELKYIKNLKDYGRLNRLVTGDVVDTLFFPSKSGMQNHSYGGDIKTAFVYRYGRDEAERLIALIEDYGRRFHKPVNIDDDIVRLMSWSCLYYAHRDAFYHMIGGSEKLIPFFDTDVFNDISWTQYWNERSWKNDKLIFRNFLKKVFGDCTEPLCVQRSLYYRVCRNVRFEKFF